MKFKSTPLNGYKDIESFLEWNRATKYFWYLTPSLRFSYNFYVLYETRSQCKLEGISGYYIL